MYLFDMELSVDVTSVLISLWYNAKVLSNGDRLVAEFLVSDSVNVQERVTYLSVFSSIMCTYGCKLQVKETYPLCVFHGWKL